MNKEQRIKLQGRKMYLSDHSEGKTSERSERFVFNALNQRTTKIDPAIREAINDPAIAKLIEEHQKGELKLWSN